MLLISSMLPIAVPVPTDGRRLLAFACGRRVSLVNDLILDFFARGLQGRRYADIPAREFEYLRDHPSTMSLFGCYVQIVNALDQGRADEVAGIIAAFAPRLDALSAAERKCLHSMLGLLDFEVAYAQAEATSDGARLAQVSLPKDVRWAAPFLAHRGAALLAALAGDRATARTELARAAAASEDSIDPATRAYEAHLQRRIFAHLQPA